MLVPEAEVVSGRRSCGGIYFRRGKLKACEVKPAVVPRLGVGDGVFVPKLFGLVAEKTREQNVAESPPLAHQWNFFDGEVFHSPVLAFLVNHQVIVCAHGNWSRVPENRHLKDA